MEKRHESKWNAFRIAQEAGGDFYSLEDLASTAPDGAWHLHFTVAVPQALGRKDESDVVVSGLKTLGFRIRAVRHRTDPRVGLFGFALAMAPRRRVGQAHVDDKPYVSLGNSSVVSRPVLLSVRPKH